MTARLRISAGPDVDHLEVITVNDDASPYVIDTPEFHGRLAVRIKGFAGEVPDGKEAKSTAPYFEAPYGDAMTYSIQVQGQFGEEVSANDLVFGNAFDRPIRVRPRGSPRIRCRTVPGLLCVLRT